MQDWTISEKGLLKTMKTQHYFIDLTQRPPSELSRSFGQLLGFGPHARQGPGDSRGEKRRNTSLRIAATDQRLVQFLWL